MAATAVTATTTVQSCTDELLWVHHDAGNLKALPYRHRVNSHVQTNYRAQKRREKAKALRASALNGRTSALKGPLLRRIAKKKVHGDHDPDSGRNPAQDPSVRTRMSHASVDGSKQMVRAISPLSPLGKGNSDPFHAYPIAIGAEENKLMTLYRDYILPSMYSLNIRDKGLSDKNLSDLAIQDWRDNVAGLEEKGTALGTLARYASIACRANPGMRQVALKYLDRSTRVLREKVSRNQNLDNFVDCLHINMLFNAEIINGNLPGAIAHGKMLLHIFKVQWNHQRLDYKMLLYQLHNDLQLTSTFLTRPVFDEGNWLPTVLKPLWDAAAPYIATYPDLEDDLDPAIEHEVVLRWFKRRRQMMRYEAIQVGDREKITCLPLVTSSFMALTFFFHCRMVHYYLDAEEQLKCDGLTNEVKSYLYAHQFLALASAQLRKWSGLSPQIMSALIYDQGRYMSALKYALEQCEIYSAQVPSDKYQNARMWALYIGALAERGSPLEQVRTSQQWFNRKLAELAWRMQVFTWNELEAILKKFLYETSAMSQGSVWFEELVLNYQLGEEIQQFLNDLSPASR